MNPSVTSALFSKYPTQRTPIMIFLSYWTEPRIQKVESLNRSRAKQNIFCKCVNGKLNIVTTVNMEDHSCYFLTFIYIQQDLLEFPNFY